VAHDRQHGIADGDDHAPGTDGTLLATESGAVVEKVFGPSAVANAIVQRRATGHIDVPETPTLDEQAASKKYVDDSTGGVFGLNADDEASEGLSSTDETTYQDKLSWASPSLTGRFRVGFQAAVGADAADKDVWVRLYNVTDASVLCEFTPRSGTANYLLPSGGFAYVDF
jgi:hypothetical protein